MPGIGPTELIVLLIIALLVLGPKRLPAAGRGLGEGLRGFKEALTQAKPEPLEQDSSRSATGAGSGPSRSVE
jgi:sec-independent protein translocase protein TatA